TVAHVHLHRLVAADHDASAEGFVGFWNPVLAYPRLQASENGVGGGTRRMARRRESRDGEHGLQFPAVASPRPEQWVAHRSGRRVIVALWKFGRDEGTLEFLPEGGGGMEDIEVDAATFADCAQHREID